MAQRLLDAADERFDGDLELHVGITEFSKDATVLSMLVDKQNRLCARLKKTVAELLLSCAEVDEDR